MRLERLTGRLASIFLCGGMLCSSPVIAGTELSENQNVVDHIGSTVKKVVDKVEMGLSRAAKKIEEKHISEKLERKLKKAATKTAEGFKKAGQKIDQKLNR